MLDKTFYEDLSKWTKDFSARMDQVRVSLEETNKILRGIQANNIIWNINRDPSDRKAFLDKLYNPDYKPTEVDQLVVEHLLQEERDKNGQEGL